MVSLASLRLDALLSKGFAISRGDASNWIAAGKVQKNWRDCTAGDELCPGRRCDQRCAAWAASGVLREKAGQIRRIQLMIERFS
ncbi:MAG: S4 domain-containing protein [Clostridia bacterium]